MQSCEEERGCRQGRDNGRNWGMRGAAVSYNEVPKIKINKSVGEELPIAALSRKELAEMGGGEGLQGTSACCQEIKEMGGKNGMP